ncbi:T9SS type A sorting domain-containing protein [Polaribacter sp. MSW13]|uniref:T9SS type A sorting domain-containing protein n=1 Tax=Polaribacter marinus TaxID=2916838 RepID=A0A9X2AK60_9FLAO|nr:ELWxxDGT repeat protein [Polaribacter marinus]MCI2227835.1 T9SS type A sorting domain-containing protein [Polaribacter marinus]
MKNAILISFLFLLLGNTAFSQNVSFFNNPSEDVSFSLTSYNYTIFKDYIFTSGYDNINGKELWKTDGTTLGTSLVKDINPGISDSSPSNFTVVGNLLFFTANDGVNGTELWKTDGTEAGTVLVKNINNNNQQSYIYELNSFKGKLIFFANDGINGSELWESDGTELGTKILKNIRPGSFSSYEPSGFYSVILNNEFYFTANDDSGKELWKTDGTEAGTVLVKDIYTGVGGSHSNPKYLTVYNGEIYFQAFEPTNTGRELWKTDGTEAGTVLVKDIKPGKNDSYPQDLITYNGNLYFSANDGNGSELWVSDGTTEGTILLKHINTNPGNTHSSPSKFIEFNGVLFFTADNGNTGHELWKTDGTEDGTVLVKDIRPGAMTSHILYINEYKGKLYFDADDGVNGKELWESDGTTAGTILKQDINIGSSSSPDNFIKFKEKLFFRAFGLTGYKNYKLSYPNTFTAASGNWNTNENWSFGVVPIANDDVEIPVGKTVNINIENLEIIDLHLLGTLNINAGKSMTAKGNLFADTGTLNIYSNATSSGSLIVNDSSSGNITYNRYVTGIDTAPEPDFKPWHLISSPVFGENVEDIITNGSLADGSGDNRKGLALYQNSVDGNPWTYFNTSSSEVMNSGNGYSVLRSTDGIIPFKGTLKTDDLEYPISLGISGTGVENKWNLIGNPYPSFIAINNDADATNNFITQNEAHMDPLFVGLYFWNPVKNSYDVINKTTDGNKYITPGQGFFIASKEDGGNITILEEMQKHQPENLFLRSTTNSIAKILLSVSNGTETKSTEIKYIAGTTTGLDPGYDAGLFNGITSDFSIYTRLLDNSNTTNIALQSLPPENYESMIVPVGLKANENTTLTFSVNATNLPNDINVYLEDRMLNSFTHLNKTNSEYTIMLESAINEIGRFYIHTTPTVLSIKNNTLSTVNIFKTNVSTIRIMGLPQGKTTFTLFNILGKQVLDSYFSANGVQDINLPKLAAGFYIVKLQTESGNLTKKIILE